MYKENRARKDSFFFVYKSIVIPGFIGEKSCEKGKKRRKIEIIEKKNDCLRKESIGCMWGIKKK